MQFSFFTIQQEKELRVIGFAQALNAITQSPFLFRMTSFERTFCCGVQSVANLFKFID